MEPTDRDRMFAKGVADGISNALAEMNRILIYLSGIIFILIGIFVPDTPNWITVSGLVCILIAYLFGKWSK